MANLLDIRRRIRSVISTRQITKAMKMISAARLRRAQERALSSRPYAKMLANVLKSLVTRAEVYDPETGEPRHPLLARREERNIFVIVVTGERGLAGAFNANIVKAAMHFLESKSGCSIEIEAVGRKGRDFFARRFKPKPKAEGEGGPAPAPGTWIAGEMLGVLGKVEFEHAQGLAEQIIDRYTRGELDSVYAVYNEFKSMIAQRLVVEQILPIGEIGTRAMLHAEEMEEKQREHAVEAATAAGVELAPPDTTEIDRRAARFGTAEVDYIYEQPADELFRALLPKYVAIQIYRSLLESVAAEHAARMTAMDSATNNASDMIDSLTLAMNRARQAKITKEIIEIVSGAAAL